jgi:L-alanine-DL-glutamate epimerase-like enolase superfamily enzyme
VKIERIEVVPYALRFREPYVTARGRLEQRELVLLRVHTEAAQGLGEAAPLSLRGGPQASAIAHDLDNRSRPLLEGAELDPGDWSALAVRCERAGIGGQALAAIELALLDLAGKLAELPGWELLGAKRAEPVSCNATLVAGSPRAVANNAATHAERGFTTFKLKVGVDGDVEQVRAVREELGPDARIRVDANGVWSSEQAISVLRAVERYEVELAEQPTAALEGLAAVRGETQIPIFADESVASAADARAALAADACDGATVKIAKVGGLRASQEILAALPVYLSSALDGPLGIAAAAHLAQVLPATGAAAGLAHGLATSELFEDTVAASECQVTYGRLAPPDGQGLGIEIDEQALERHRR